MSRDRDSSRRSATGAQADRILEQALKHELRSAGTSPVGGCLDAETLGAWTDGGLDAAAMPAAEAHVSSCARCQAMVGAFAHSAVPVENTVAAPAFAWWKWGLAPIAAGLTAATLWMVIPEEQQIADAPQPAKESAARQTIPPIAPAPAAPAAPPARAEADQFAARDSASPLARENRSRPSAVVDNKLEEGQAKIQERVALADSAGSAAAAGARAEAPPNVPPPAAVALEAAPAAQLGSLALQKRAAGNDGLKFEVPTLRPSIRWRVIGDFFIELTLDSGATWIRKHQLPGINAGAAPSALVCWFVGGNGSVWLTTDGGATFRNVGLAEPLDIASISASNATTAQVFTVSGRRFQTADAGRTWQPF